MTRPAAALASVGPGAVAAVALLAPMAMAAARRARIPPFLAALAVTNGANAGNLSPFSTVGVAAVRRRRLLPQRRQTCLELVHVRSEPVDAPGEFGCSTWFSRALPEIRDLRP